MITSLKTLLAFILLLCSISLLSFDGREGQNKISVQQIRLNETEKEIFRQINEYRKQKSLKPIPVSPSLCYVAWLHVRDLADNLPANQRCNLHSWSEGGPWTSCCYTEDHKRASCMWSKPRELTTYKADGYEIAYWTNELLFPNEFASKAVRGWKRSPHHNEVIVNIDQWSGVEWKAMGVGYYKGYAVVWFGTEPDYPRIAKE